MLANQLIQCDNLLVNQVNCLFMGFSLILIEVKLHTTLCISKIQVGIQQISDLVFANLTCSICNNSAHNLIITMPETLVLLCTGKIQSKGK